jgi:VWFA-related protein
MSRWPIAVAAASCLIASAAARQAPPNPLVLLDIVATDGNGKPVTDLRREDFQISDDGKPVTIESFDAVTADGSSPASARSILVVLDDSGVPASGTNALRTLSQNLLSRMGPADQIGIVRLNDPGAIAKEPEAAMALIAKFAAGTVPFVPDQTLEDAFMTMATLSRSLTALPKRRKGIVCIGSPVVCGMAEVSTQAPRALYPNWKAAVTAAAEANVGVYGIIPQNTRIGGTTLAEVTGGQLFITTSAFEQAFDRIWSELSRYYLVGYTPASSSGELPQIGVKVARRGVQVRARVRRGNRPA